MIPLTTNEIAEYAKKIDIMTRFRFDAGIVNVKWNTYEEWIQHGGSSGIQVLGSGRIQATEGKEGVWISRPVSNPYLKEFRDIDFQSVPYDQDDAFLFEAATSNNGKTWGDWIALTRKAVGWTQSTQISGLTLSGLSRDRMNGGKYYLKIEQIVYSGSVMYVFSLNQSAGVTTSVGSPSRETVARGFAFSNFPMNVGLFEINGSGVSGVAAFSGWTADEELTVSVGWSIREIQPAPFIKFRITIYQNEDLNYIGAFFFTYKLDIDFDSMVTNIGAIQQNLTQNRPNNFKSGNITLELTAPLQELRRVEKALFVTQSSSVFIDIYSGFGSDDHMIFRGVMEDRGMQVDLKRNKTTITVLDFLEDLRRRQADADLKDSEGNWLANRTINSIVRTGLNKAGIFDHSLVAPQPLGTEFDLLEYGYAGSWEVMETWETPGQVYILSAKGGILKLASWQKDFYDEEMSPVFDKSWEISNYTNVHEIEKISLPLDISGFDCYYVRVDDGINTLINVIFINRITGEITIKKISASWWIPRSAGVSITRVSGSTLAFNVLFEDGDDDFRQIYAWTGMTSNSNGTRYRFTINSVSGTFLLSQSTSHSSFYYSNNNNCSEGRGGIFGRGVLVWPCVVFATVNVANKRIDVGCYYFGPSRAGAFDYGIQYQPICACNTTLSTRASGFNPYAAVFQFVQISSDRFWFVLRYKATNNHFYDLVYSCVGTRAIAYRHGTTGILKSGSGDPITYLLERNTARIFSSGTARYSEVYGTTTEDQTVLTKFPFTSAASIVPDITAPNGIFRKLYYSGESGLESGSPKFNYLAYLAGPPISSYFGMVGNVPLVIPSAEIFSGSDMFSVLSTLASGYNFFFGTTQGRAYFLRDRISTEFVLNEHNIVKMGDVAMSYKNIFNVIDIDYNSGVSKFSKQDNGSVSKYGRRPLSLSLPHIDSAAVAELVADAYLNLWKTPYYSVSVDMKYSPQLEIIDGGWVDCPEIINGSILMITDLSHDWKANRTILKLLIAESPDHSYYGISEYGADSDYG